ncbi:hypothetical protein EV182_005035 [Spiromyces aspiralis]|uniref:Uncharacterized protein n=1 Tax=Spiromyces aspiralis TaxID=68401 RepID=A0ACC1HI06_9FUNG|nr:hypothetical protein EV182_005035 [Spiromyces aspiralis]
MGRRHDISQARPRQLPPVGGVQARPRWLWPQRRDQKLADRLGPSQRRLMGTATLALRSSSNNKSGGKAEGPSDGKGGSVAMFAFEKTLQDLIETQPQVFKPIQPAPLFWTKLSPVTSSLHRPPAAATTSSYGDDRRMMQWEDYFNPDFLEFPPQGHSLRLDGNSATDGAPTEMMSELKQALESEICERAGDRGRSLLSGEDAEFDKVQVKLLELSECVDPVELYRFIDREFDGLAIAAPASRHYPKLMIGIIDMARKFGHLGLVYYLYLRCRYDLPLESQLKVLSGEVYEQLIKGAWDLGNDALMIERFLIDMISTGVLASQSLKLTLGEIMRELRLDFRLSDWANQLLQFERKLQFE